MRKTHLIEKKLEVKTKKKTVFKKPHMIEKFRSLSDNFCTPTFITLPKDSTLNRNYTDYILF